MDVFESLGLDVPLDARSMSVTDGIDEDFMAFLPTLFGWDEKEASANSLVLFPGESQQGDRGDGGLLALPSIKSRDQSELPAAASTAAAGVKLAEDGTSLKASPFSGMTEFNLFLADPLPSVTAAQPAPGEDDPQQQGATPADTAFPALAAAETSVPFVQGAPDQLLQSEYSQGLLGLLASADIPDQQQQPQPQPPLAQVQTQVPAVPQQQAPVVASPFGGAMLPPQQLQQLGLGSSGQPGTSLPAGALTPPTPQQQLMPPPLPVPAAALQPQMQFQTPLISPLLLQQPFSFGAPHTAAAGLQPQYGMASPVMELPVPLQPQQQQQRVSGDAHSGDGDAMSDGEGGGDHKQHAGGQPKRRGRPPKVPGQYSKGYEAIKRYREKKKGMVEHMEAEIAHKREELQKLQAEQEVLRSRQQALESTMSNQDQLLAQLLQVKLSVIGRSESMTNPDLEATTAAAIAGVRQALAMQNGGDPAAEQAAAAAAGAQQRQRALHKQQLAQQKVLSEGPVYLRRYQGYVQAVADALQQAAAAGVDTRLSAAAAGAGAPPPFPTFPFTLVETLSLWQLSRLAIMTRTNLPFASVQQGGAPEEVWDDFTLNLSTGQHDLVPQGFWKGVAGKVGMYGEQPVQLGAAWRLYANAMQALNEERNRLLLQLQEAAAAEEGIGTPPPGTAAGDGSSGAELSGTDGAGGSAAAAGSSSGAVGCSVTRRTGITALELAEVYTGLLDAVERNLLRGRAVVMMFGWSILCMFSAEQIGAICVHSWPYFPLIRAVAGYMLGKEDLVP